MLSSFSEISFILQIIGLTHSHTWLCYIIIIDWIFPKWAQRGRVQCISDIICNFPNIRRDWMIIDHDEVDYDEAYYMLNVDVT